jgi:3-dehydroquinate synthase
MPIVRVRLQPKPQSYDINIGTGLLTETGDAIRDCLGRGARKAAIISNESVFTLYGKTAAASLRAAGFAVKHFLVPEGERQKSFRSLEKLITFFSESRLERSDVAVALGGGVIGDLTGFAAATYLRGISFVQVPTTLLAQIDASVGGKTGINLPEGKNLVGAFHQPRLVLIDTETLNTLPRRELTSGFAEMVKQGAIGSRKLFDQTVRLLSSIDFSLWDKRLAKAQTKVSATGLAETIAAHCRFKALIVAGDEREEISRTDSRSRRILNFGHTTAHALEKTTNYRRFRHGEAVAYGMLVAGEISKSLCRLPPGELESLREAVALCGPLPAVDEASPTRIIRAMAVDKKAVAGKLKWVLLDRIGQPRIVDGSEIKPNILRAAIVAGLSK